MDKRSLLAFVLIGIVLAIWMIVNSVYQQPPLKQEQIADSVRTEQQIEDSSSFAQDEIISSDTTSQEVYINADSLKHGSFFSNFVKDEEKEITIESDLFIAKLTNKGAGISFWQLKKYKHNNGSPTQLIESDLNELFLVFETRERNKIDTRDFYFTFENLEKTEYKLKENDSLVLNARLGYENGSAILKKFVFYGNSYSFINDISIRQMDTILQKGYRFVWGDGLCYQEKNASDESNEAIAMASLNGAIEELNADGADPVTANYTGIIDYAATKTKYFGAAIIPQPYRSFDGTVDLLGRREFYHSDRTEEKYSLIFRIPYSGGTITNSFRVYLGPLDYDLLSKYNLTDMINFGWRWLVRPIGEFIMLPFFKMIYMFVNNYGISIIIFAIFMKILLYPLSITQMRSAQKMKLIAPEMTKIRDKYKDDQKQQQTEIMKLYSEYGVNPAGGCLPLLLQMPILYALWAVLRTAIDLRQASFFLWITDLSLPDVIIELPFPIPIFNLKHFSGLALLMGVTLFFQQKLTLTDPRQKFMIYILPVVFTLMFSYFPSGLNLYYFMFNLIGIGQQVYMNKFSKKKMTLEDLKKMPKKEGWMQKKMREAQEIAAAQGRAVPGKQQESPSKSKYSRKKKR
ncbi:MAG: membrane protein insertase YidC [Ignavibacteria bacterium]|jgi:YidC/Oxa1 family membrane protein insertase|nr:membrane protein insertase YidC [Ignavibacteria bacterium]